MAKLITKEQWSTKKKNIGSDKILRDQWHIGDHLDEYFKLEFKAFDERINALTEIKRKFGAYKTELANKDKKKVCLSLLTDIDKIVVGVGAEITTVKTKKAVSEGSPDAMKQECAEHLELRKRVIPIVQDVEKQMTALLDEVKTGASIAAKGAAQAVSTKQGRDLSNNMVARQVAAGGSDRAQQALLKAEGLEKGVITLSGGEVLSSREDGPIRTHQAKLDPEYVRSYKEESGRYFAEATKVTVRINTALAEIKNLAREAQTSQEEADANTMQTLDTGKLEANLRSINENATKVKSIFELAGEKLDGDSREITKIRELPNTTDQDKLKSLKLKYESQFLPRKGLIEGRRADVATVVKRVRIIPTQTDSPTVDNLRREAAETARQLTLMYQTTLQKAAVIEGEYTTAIHDFGG